MQPTLKPNTMQHSNPFLPEILQAIDDIVTANTLPPQIDYARPWVIKARAAEELIKTYPKPTQRAIQEVISAEMDDYAEAAFYDSQF